jgi:HSP20 family protein
MNFLTRWDPFDELTLLRNRMDRLLNKIGDEETPALAAVKSWAPTTDIIETKEGLILRCELPGIEEKDVNVEIENGVLTISGERKLEETAKEKNFHRVERAYGKFIRSFTLPPNVATDDVKATFTAGLLELTLPKKEEAKPKKIHLEIQKKLATAA